MDNSVSSISEDIDPAPPSDGVPGAYRLSSQLDLTAARALQQDLKSRLTLGPVVLEAQDVERMSTPCMQVVLAAGLAAASANIPFRIVAASDNFSAAVVDLGLQSQFSNWME